MDGKITITMTRQEALTVQMFLQQSALLMVKDENRNKEGGKNEVPEILMKTSLNIMTAMLYDFMDSKNK